MKTTLSFHVGLALALLLTIGAGAASSQVATQPLPAGERRKIEGTVVSRDGDKLVVRIMPNDSDVTVKVGSFTEIQEKKSNPFRGARKYQASQLAPGLSVEVEGRPDADGALVAQKIRFTHTDFKIAKAADARVAPVEENSRRMSGQIEELDAVSNATRGGAKAAQSTADRAHERITNLDDYDAVANIAVRFKVGSAVLSPEAKTSLDQLAEQAKSRKGFVIEVAGFASAEGGAELNRRLSRQRAQAVTEYLAEKHDIPIRRIMSPTGYGVSHPVADNKTRTGREENRRVEVRILVSRGLAATAGAQTQDAAAPATKRTP
jgi:outer membrane protein OmpA-like peptidoglycan-associated protein